ncbi:hypothetical protein [Sandaracinus amylolyticus]|uniref:DUF423 domain-containing protein n=1 Tax=Sandaracinus amylolyticus TaxID=927083 RepID=A0A0F6YJR3_9BACT|nr:hypothetical protein [Sandaracinus amylolyticus]AKF06410.1 hypothetical protein DB32_003559 [Sandaracinus amylolyticus]
MTIDARRRACRRLGWSALLAWALFGLALEAMHGFKIGAYLDDALARELLVLAHAHGVGLSLVVLVFGEAGAPLFEHDDHGATRALHAGAMIVPFAFALSSIAHPEGDPNVVVWLVPIGALLVVYALACAALASWRQGSSTRPHDS